MAVDKYWNTELPDLKNATTRAGTDQKSFEAELPFVVQYELCQEFLEPGMPAISQTYFENMLDRDEVVTQKLIQQIYSDACRKRKHQLSWNIVLILSQLPYEKLGLWAIFLAVTATRSPFRDVKEMGIRCFENWEELEALEFLGNCSFEEQWLQEYADSVCEFLTREGRKNVLYEKNQPWEMAGRDENKSGNLERHTGRYDNSGTEDDQQQIISLEGWKPTRTG